MQALSSLIANYLETGQYEKQLSPDTIKAYRIDLQQFSDFTKGVWADKNMLDQYIKYLNQRFAPRSVKRKLASLRAFYHEMEILGELLENPFDKLHIRIHSPQQLPRIIPEQIVQSLLQSAYDAYTPGCREVLRDIVVLELLFSTGLRVSELCALSQDTLLVLKLLRSIFFFILSPYVADKAFYEGTVMANSMVAAIPNQRLIFCRQQNRISAKIVKFLSNQHTVCFGISVQVC